MSEPDYPQKVTEIAEVASKICTEWECDFIESIQGRNLDVLSDKQKAVIDRIYKKVCDSPY